MVDKRKPIIFHIIGFEIYFMKLDILVSHNSENQDIAEKLKDIIETTFPNTRVYVSGRDLEGGQTWISEIKNHLSTSKVIISLITKKSIGNLWVYFESGAGFVDDKTIPLVYYDLSLKDLTPPLSLLQARDFTANGFKLLFEDLQKKLDTTLKPRSLEFASEMYNEILTDISLKKLHYLYDFFSTNEVDTDSNKTWVYQNRCLVFDYVINGFQVSVDVYFDRPTIEIEIFGRNKESSTFLFNKMLKDIEFSGKPFSQNHLKGDRYTCNSFDLSTDQDTIKTTLLNVLVEIKNYKAKFSL